MNKRQAKKWLEKHWIESFSSKPLSGPRVEAMRKARGKWRPASARAWDALLRTPLVLPP